jgi:hypothetical protein
MASFPKLLAMLSIQPPIRGDEALLRLAQVRLAEAGLGGELYPGSPDHLARLLAYRPYGQACTAHLPRDIDLTSDTGQAVIEDYATCAAGQLYGILVHDQKVFQAQPEAALLAFAEAERRLQGIAKAPLLFVEYAAGLPLDLFAELFEQTAELEHVCAAIDVSHVAIYVCRQAYAAQYRDEDVCALRPNSPGLAERIGAVQAAVASAEPAVVKLMQRLARLHKPLHLHLHDGHPLSTLSAFGVSDHLSFLQHIRIPFSYQGRQTLSGVFGISGLRALMQAAMAELSVDQLSCMLEIHPQEGRSPLTEHAHLFSHWEDMYFAERMNYWLDRLLDNSVLLKDACALSKKSF